MTHTSGLHRDIDVITVLGREDVWEGGGLGVNEIARQTGRDRAQISRVCKTLQEAGILHRLSDTSRYVLGPRLYTLAQQTEESRLAAIAEPYLLDLVARAEESSYLMVLRGGAVFCVKASYAQHSLQAGWVVGHMLPALRAASGRAILSTFSTDELAAWWIEHGDYKPNPFPPAKKTGDPEPLQRLKRTPGNIKTLRGLTREATKVRARGFAISAGEMTPGVVDAASVVRTDGGRVVAALAVGAPRERLAISSLPLGLAVAEAARRMSEELGWLEPLDGAPLSTGEEETPGLDDLFVGNPVATRANK
jgi:DNA-binding IclR family transcriptional regulator